MLSAPSAAHRRLARLQSITITPTGGTAVTLTLTASATTNTGINFEVSATAATNAANLAAAINRNLSSTALDRIVAVASAGTVTVYALTPGSRVTLTTRRNPDPFQLGCRYCRDKWRAKPTSSPSISSTVGQGHRFVVYTNPEFIFSYASGVGPVTTSPGLSSVARRSPTSKMTRTSAQSCTC